MPPALHTERLILVPLDMSFADRYHERECKAAEAHYELRAP